MVQLADKHGLEVFLLRFNSSAEYADKIGAAVRIRRKNTITPTCDIFFVAETNNRNEVAKADSWNGEKINFNESEVFDKSWIYPTKYCIVDDMELSFPNQPEKVLMAQYGPKCFEYN